MHKPNKRMNSANVCYIAVLSIQMFITGVVCLSPAEFQQLYAVTDGMQIERRPQSKSRPIYGYIAPTERPTHGLSYTPHVTRYTDRLPYIMQPQLTTKSIYRFPTERPDRYTFVDVPQPINAPYSYNDIDVGAKQLENVQNLVHLRNLHSLAHAANQRKKIPYGYIRKGKQFWKDMYHDADNHNPKTSAWAAQAMVTDSHGEESVIVERGVRYTGPHPAVSNSKNKRDKTETEYEPENRFRDRKIFQWDTEIDDNSITKRPINTLLKPQELSMQEPVTFKTKVKASIGVEPNDQSEDLIKPSVNTVLLRPTTSTQPFEPLASPPSSNALTSTYSSAASTTAQNDRAVLPSPQQASQNAIGTTQPTYGEASGSNGSKGISYEGGNTSNGEGSGYSGSSSYTEIGISPNTDVGGSSYGEGSISYGMSYGPNPSGMDFFGSGTSDGFDRLTKTMALGRLFHVLVEAKAGHAMCQDQRGVRGRCSSSEQCRKAGGTPTDRGCTGGKMCCISYVLGCNVQSRINDTLWVSPPATPSSTGTTGGNTSTSSLNPTGGTCVMKVHKLTGTICQLRLDFVQFEVSPPTDGACRNDKFVVFGQNINSGIPHLCGLNTGQHVYVDVDTVPGPFLLTMVTVGNFPRRWQIQVSQVDCRSPYRPPANCLQFFMGFNGNISSFNFRTDINTTYTNFLNYAICLRKEHGFCTVEYENTGNAENSTLDIVNIATLADGSSVPTVHAGVAGVGIQQCPDDYLLLGGTRLCGQTLNDGSIDAKFTNNAPITDKTNGPFRVEFVSDGQNIGKGFKITYQQYPC